MTQSVGNLLRRLIIIIAAMVLLVENTGALGAAVICGTWCFNIKVLPMC